MFTGYPGKLLSVICFDKAHNAERITSSVQNTQREEEKDIW